MVYKTTLSAPVFALRNELDRVFGEVFGGEMPTAIWTPAVDVHEAPTGLTLFVELPGVNPEAVEIVAENGVLTVRGSKTSEASEGEGARYRVVERAYGSFSRSFRLPKGTDESKIEAEFSNGVLSIRVPSAALPQPKRVEIRAKSGSGPQEIRASSGSGDDATNHGR
ncbi:MAG: Hsp20/alpha crystallin family protein [Gemmatimonadaceae bacterium]